VPQANQNRTLSAVTEDPTENEPGSFSVKQGLKNNLNR